MTDWLDEEHAVVIGSVTRMVDEAFRAAVKTEAQEQIVATAVRAYIAVGIQDDELSGQPAKVVAYFLSDGRVLYARADAASAHGWKPEPRPGVQ